MSHLNFSFQEINSENSIAELASVFNTTSLNGSIQIPSSSGAGTIKKIELDRGITMRLWNFNLNQSISFHKLPDSNAEEGKIFNISYLFTPGSVEIRRKGFQKTMHLPSSINTIFFSGDSEIDFEFNTGSSLHAVALSVTYSWLRQAFSDDDAKIKSFIEELNNRQYPTMLLESSSPEEYRVVSDIYGTGTLDLKSLLHLKAEVLLLVAEFFKKISSGSATAIPENNIVYYERIIKAEKILKENLNGIFPGIDGVAKKVSLSESTLKRYFKKVFHKSLHEYYLELKMEHAKRLMLEKNVTVNEVASILSYKKVSSFIETFKKHHGYSPGQLKRKS